MEEMLLHIGNYGFPMVVAAYLLVRVEKRLDMLTQAIRDLQQTIGYLSCFGHQDRSVRYSRHSHFPETKEAGEKM